MKKLPLIKDLLVFVVLNVAIFGLVYLCCVGGPGLMNWWVDAGDWMNNPMGYVIAACFGLAVVGLMWYKVNELQTKTGYSVSAGPEFMIFIMISTLVPAFAIMVFIQYGGQICG